jgi:hypothetical protein
MDSSSIRWSLAKNGRMDSVDCFNSLAPLYQATTGCRLFKFLIKINYLQK